MESRNDLCGCHSGAKYKKCCGRFSLQEMTSKLSEFAANNRKKDRLIERGLKMLTRYAVNPERDYLCLVNPKQDAEGLIAWTIVGGSIPADEREAVVTRRVLAGYLPVGCLLRNPDWSMMLDKSLVPEELHAVYVAFARLEMGFIAKTIDGQVDHNDGSITPLKWSDRGYPGQPIKPRKPGTIKIEVDMRNRSIRFISEPLNSHLDMPIDDDMIEGENDEDAAMFVAQDIMAALEEIPQPEGTVLGDMFEVYLMEAEGTPKLLARTESEAISYGLTGGFGMGGAA
jgi:hypothetical protein